MKILILDGYNTIHKIGYLSAIADRSLKEARSEVTRLANDYKRRIGGISEVYVIFDGQSRFQDTDIPKPKEHIFSATGMGDRKIVDTIRKFSSRGKLMVVSDDNYVRNSARAYKAGLLRPTDLVRRKRKRGFI